MSFSLTPRLDGALASLAERLDGTGVTWVVEGGTARALLGFRTTPRDLDVVVEANAFERAARLLGLTGKPHSNAGVRSMRAMGTWRDVEVDLLADLRCHGPGGNLHVDFPLLRLFAKPVELARRTVWVAPVEEQIARNVVLGDAARLERIADERPAGFRLDETYLSLRLAAASAAR